MIALAVERQVAVTMACVALALAGLASAVSLPIAIMPEVDLPRLTVPQEIRRVAKEK